MLQAAIKFFGKHGSRHLGKRSSTLKEKVSKSNLNMLVELYIGKMILASLVGFFALLFSSFFALVYVFGMSHIFAAVASIALALAGGAVTALLFYFYPFHIIAMKKRSIDVNMPFAINHMAAIAISGVPPTAIFRLLSGIPEYGEVSKEAGRITRNIEVFGMDVTTSIKNVAERTPSPAFRQFLYSILATITTGGDVGKFLKNSAEEALFDYRIQRQKYIQTLSTYADFYTAVLIAAPLFFVSVLSVLALVGGQIFGMSIPDAIRLGTLVFLPLLNMTFIAFVHYTQPDI
ncbi:MAG: type II secretion system F family protein [Candidatus Aenigmarchaeota archaeon]|nr:type II secretion system F family protein [Candidatus Aenigmarchaeota archaeon]